MRAFRFAVAAALAASLLAVSPMPAQTGNPVSVQLELNQKFFYEGDPLWVRVTVRNNGSESIENPIRTDLFKGFQVSVPGADPISSSGKPGAPEPQRPKTLAPRAFYGTVVDLTRIYPELGRVGSYQINWSADRQRSGQLTVRVIPKFDAGKAYSAEISTTAGRIVVDLHSETAPIAVKAFVDMANSGFYDGLQIHEIRPDAMIAGGNPEFGDGRERYAFTYPAEISKGPFLAGTVVMKPVGAAPPSNGPEFIILLRPQPGWAGQVTALGQITAGLDVAQAISKRPSSEQNSRPYFKPVQEITIRNIRISAKEATP